MVELIAQYSKHGRHKLSQLESVQATLDRHIADAQSAAEERQRPTARWRLVDRLSETDLQAIADSYEAGETAASLGEHYGASKSAVLDLLRARGVTVRGRGLTRAMERQILSLRSRGMVIRTIAKQVGCSYDTARRFILRANRTSAQD